MESYEQINYAVRPNKRTQRKMIFEALARYVPIFPKKRFAYVGFGSMWFADFLYAHRRLGLKTLVSIERTDGYRRARFNKPFKCVKVLEGDSADILPSLDWTRASIVWLDYDFRPEDESLQDIALLAGRLVSSSILMVTYDARPPWKEGANKRAREARLRKAFGDAVPYAVKKLKNKQTKGSGSGKPQTAGSDYAITLVSVLWTHLKNLLIQNGRAEKVEWLPLFSFHYKDGAPMVTIGAALVDRQDAQRVGEGELQNHLSFLRGETVFPIAVPPLTQKERAALDRCLPSKTPKPPFPLPADQLESYAQLYPYYPLFAEVEL